MIDLFQEIWGSLRRNKTRTTLTGLSVSWGIFILIVLIGAGNGLRNGVMSNFSSRAFNRIDMYPGTTSMPYKGLKSERNISFTSDEVDFIREEIEESRYITARINRQYNISYGKEYGSYQVRGVMPNYKEVEQLEFNAGDGRFINELDMSRRNKIIVLDKKLARSLFRGQNAIGKDVKVGNVMFKVVGINSKKQEWGRPNAYIPFTTAQAIFNPDGKFNHIAFTVDGLNTKEANELFNKKLKNAMGRKLKFDADDQQAIWIYNSQENFLETQKIFRSITIFVSIIGLLTLVAGIVGVSNIMLVSVKERTREIGIRKAIGAKPSSILKSIILESIMITSIFGYIGMVFGIAATELANYYMIKTGGSGLGNPQMSVFLNPTVDVGPAIFATVVLVAAGVMAGYLPARKAVKVKPVEAMR
jgi:putative ABC transport system permease protein